MEMVIVGAGLKPAGWERWMGQIPGGAGREGREKAAGRAPGRCDPRRERHWGVAPVYVDFQAIAFRPAAQKGLEIRIPSKQTALAPLLLPIQRARRRAVASR